MLRPNQNQTNFFSVLYDRIPEDHLLKRISNAVDFSFINAALIFCFFPKIMLFRKLKIAT